MLTYAVDFDGEMMSEGKKFFEKPLPDEMPELIALDVAARRTPDLFLRIEHEEPLAFVDLRDIISIVDDELRRPVLEELESNTRVISSDNHDLAGVRDLFALREAIITELKINFKRKQVSFLSIDTISQGSIIMGLIGMGIFWAAAHVTTGVRKSVLANNLQKLGLNLGNIAGSRVDIINKKLESFNEELSEQRNFHIKAELIRSLDPDTEPDTFGNSNNDDPNSTSYGQR